MCHIEPKQRAKPNQPPVILKGLMSIHHETPGHKPFMDMIFDNGPREVTPHAKLILIDESGRVWGWSIGSEVHAPYDFVTPRIRSQTDGYNFRELLIELAIENNEQYTLSKVARHWRLAPSGLAGLIYVTSGKFLARVDLRVGFQHI